CVKGANTALEKVAAARASGDCGSANQRSMEVQVTLGGPTNRWICWKNLSPAGGGRPTGAPAPALEGSSARRPGSAGHFAAPAPGVRGSGWAVLAYEPLGGKLVIEQFYDQQNGAPVATIPLFQLDMWEHAFYLDYQNVKADYVKAIWNIVNWADVQQRFENA